MDAFGENPQAGAGVDTIESVLLYHVVPGATIDKRAAFRSDNARLTTAAGSKIKVDVREGSYVLRAESGAREAKIEVGAPRPSAQNELLQP